MNTEPSTAAVGNDFGRAVSRILSASLAGRREPFVWAAYTRNRFRLRETWSGQLRGPLFGLAPDGVFRASALALGAVGSYPTFSPLPTPLAKHRRFEFLWHCPSAGLAACPPACIPDESGLRGIAPCGVRTFLPRLAPGAILHPSKIEANLHCPRPYGKRCVAMLG